MKIKNCSKSSKMWLKEHFKDPYVIEAHKKKFRSRAYFKLLEIQKKYNVFKLGMHVIDLGSSPGSWSQYASKKVGKNGKIIACDILPMSPISNVIFFQGDFCSKFIYNILKRKIKQKVQICMSDTSPNISGISYIDIPKMLELMRFALKICLRFLEPGGTFLLKIFQGKDVDQFLKKIRLLFNKVKIYKPYACRSRSKEIYIIAKEKKIIM